MNDLKKEKVDIWMEAVKTIVGYHKRTLLDFIDTIGRQSTNLQEKERLGRIKGRVHNDLSQCALTVGVMFETYRTGGDISPFRDSMLENRPEHRDKKRFNNYHKPINPVLKDTDANV